MVRRWVFPTNSELVNSFVVYGLPTRRRPNTLPHVFVTMVVNRTFSQKFFHPTSACVDTSPHRVNLEGI